MTARLFSLSCAGCRWAAEQLGRGLPPAVSRPLSAYGMRARAEVRP
jgi:hypothetical protein